MLPCQHVRSELLGEQSLLQQLTAAGVNCRYLSLLALQNSEHTPLLGAYTRQAFWRRASHLQSCDQLAASCLAIGAPRLLKLTHFYIQYELQMLWLLLKLNQQHLGPFLST